MRLAGRGMQRRCQIPAIFHRRKNVTGSADRNGDRGVFMAPGRALIPEHLISPPADPVEPRILRRLLFFFPRSEHAGTLARPLADFRSFV